MPAKIIRPSFTREDERGTLVELLNEGTWGSVVQGKMKPGAVMGNHYHKETTVFFFLFSGMAEVLIEEVTTGARSALTLHAMEGVTFAPYESHSVTFLQDGSYLLLRSQAYDPQNRDTYDHPVT